VAPLSAVEPNRARVRIQIDGVVPLVELKKIS